MAEARRSVGRIVLVLFPLVLLLGLPGCGPLSSRPGSSGSPGAPGSGGDSGAGTSPPSSQTPPPTLHPPSTPPRTPTDQVKPLTVSGVVEQGAYPGCLELVTEDNLRYTLVGPVRWLRPGDRVTVRGQPHPERETSCSGVVLLVRDVLR